MAITPTPSKPRAQRGAGLWAGSFERPRDWRVEHGGMAEGEHDLFAADPQLAAGDLRLFMNGGLCCCFDKDMEEAMKLFDGGRAPNPRRVRIFLAEKGISVPLVPVDMAALEHKKEADQLAQSADAAAGAGARRRHHPHRDRSRSAAISRSCSREPALFGNGALGKAVVEMWQRRVEFNLFAAVAAAFRHIHPAMKEWEIPQVPEWGEVNKPKAVDFMRILDRELATREFVAGDAFSIADITGLCRARLHEAGAHRRCPKSSTHVLRWHAGVEEPAERRRLRSTRRARRAGRPHPRLPHLPRAAARPPAAARAAPGAGARRRRQRS